MQAKHLTDEELQNKVRENWLATAELMEGRPYKEILKCCSKRAAKLVQ